jgi:hemolysin activation/secretion protein
VDGGFTKLNVSASHYHGIGKNFGVLVAAQGQWTDDPLLASEEIAVGGAPFGRGYAYGEISGDRGGAATVELRASARPSLRPVSFVQSYAFFDAARVANFHAPAGSRPLQLASTGVGARIGLADRVEFRLEAAKPLSRIAYERNDKAWRGFFGASVSF